jgi:hypothetical protein
MTMHIDSTDPFPCKLFKDRSSEPDPLQNYPLSFQHAPNPGARRTASLCFLFGIGKSYSIGYGTHQIIRITSLQNRMRTNLFLRSHFPDRSHQEGYVGAVIPRSRKFNPSRQVFGSGQIPGRPSSPPFREPVAAGLCSGLPRARSPVPGSRSR